MTAPARSPLSWSSLQLRGDNNPDTGGGQQRDQPPHEGLCRQGEGDSFLRCVLVAAIFEAVQA